MQTRRLEETPRKDKWCVILKRMSTVLVCFDKMHISGISEGNKSSEKLANPGLCKNWPLKLNVSV